MKEKSTKEKLRTQTNWKWLRQKSDKGIDYRDIPPTNAEFWKDAELVVQPKIHLSIRLDADIVEFFKELGPGYQSRINAVLRAYIRVHMN